MLQLHDIRKSYKVADFSQVALDDVSIAFRDNEFVAILGPSGSGKTTMLNVIGGLDHYDSGELIIDGINTSNYTDRDWDTYRNNRIGFVFQSYNLIPHQSVLANVELALTLTGVSRAERRERALAELARVGLAEHVNKKPSQLSGGQMQRVAIARALINDPEILLADEPTGALDSETSVQIMALLTQIASDRLVIMVTHNPELAQQYATRTVSLLDGRIASDTDPFDPRRETEHDSKATRRTGMSFFTAIALSFNNLMTKKGRTLMTAFAGSIGIIGIAAILALANGVNNYIKSIEEDTLSVYPLTILSQGMDMSALLAISSEMGDDPGGTAAEDATEEESVEVGQVHEVSMLSKMLTSVGSNDLAALKKFFDDNGGNIDDYANLIQYSYNVTPQIFTVSDKDSVRQVNPDTTFAALGFGSMGPMASAMQTNAFAEMMDDPSLIEQQYDLLAGTWPQEEDEVLLVLTPSGGISDFVLFAMGLRDPAQLDTMIRQMVNEENVVAPTGGPKTFSYEEIMDVSFKLVNAADYYKFDETYGIWTDHSGDAVFLRGLAKDGMDLTISGIVQPAAGVTATALTPGLYYTPSLTTHLIEQAGETEVVKAQLANPKMNIFTGRTFAEEADSQGEGAMDMSKLFSIDEDAIAAAFQFDESMLSIDPSVLDFSSLNMPNMSLDPSTLPTLDLGFVMEDMGFDVGAIDLDINQILGNVDLSGIDLGVTQEDVTQLAEDMAVGYAAFCLAGNDCTDPQASFEAFMQSPEGVAIAEQFQALSDQAQSGLEDAQAQVTKQLLDAISKVVQDQIAATSGQLQTQLQSAMTAYMTQAMTAISAQIQDQIGYALQTQISSAMGLAMSGLADNMAAAMSIDQAAFMDAFQFNLDEKELQQVVMAMMMTESTSFDSNIAKLGWADFARPYSIDIFPKDFEAKGQIVTILDDYNAQMKADGNEDMVITYTDLVGTLMSSVTDIVNVISYVLVAFVAISLVVSSIMIGVITYISVLERKKEIGILRSIGASKRDIRLVFNAETLIVGFVAGVMGIGVTLLLTIPANAIVYARWGVKQVAVLPWQAGVALVAISMALTYLAGLIPSSAASRKDPVEALRSE